MSTTFPTAIDTFTNPIAGDTTNSVSVAHHSQHANANDAIAALQTLIFNKTNMNLAASKLVPGATSLSFRNNADSRDNVLLLDNGSVTFAPQTNNVTVSTSVASDRTITNHTSLIVNQYGVGIGFTPQVGVKAVFGLGVTWTDPTAESKVTSMSQTLSLTGNNAQPNDTLNPSLYILDGGFNFTSANGQWSVLSETHVQTPSSGTHTLVGGTTGSAWLDAGSTGNATELRGVQGYTSMGSTSTAPLVTGGYFYCQLTASGGSADGNITLMDGIRVLLSNQTGGATPGVVATGEGIRILAPVNTATGSFSLVRGICILAQRNTNGGSSTTGGYSAYGLYVEVPNQGGNTSASNNNRGIYITSNGGTAGGGGGVTNRALYSDSTASSNILGGVRIGSVSTISALATLQVDGLILTIASATGTAGLRLPHGAAPTSPVDGDVWTTSSGIFVRVNGSTVGPLS